MNHAKSSLGPPSCKADRDYLAIAKPIAAANFVVPTPCRRGFVPKYSRHLGSNRNRSNLTASQSWIQNNLCPEVESLSGLPSKFHSGPTGPVGEKAELKRRGDA
jgi:hypothetical protein